jgi:predicted TIM-barrel fold metal-dependent hydrolase
VGEGVVVVSEEALTRRELLQVAGAGALAALLPSDAPAVAADDDAAPLIIDCHAHIYGDDAQKYPTIADPYRPPTGKGTISHLRSEMQANGVRYATAVQTSTYYGWDNRFTTDSSRDNADVMVGICTLNPDDKGSPALLEEYVKQKKVRGMRSIVAASGKLDDPGVEALWATAERLGIVINVLANREQRPEIETLVKRHPELRIVIDHCLNLKAGPTLKATLRDMLAFARFPTVHAKLTFIPTGSAEAYPCRDMHQCCHAVIREYGSQRCVWGSDFPCELWCRAAKDEPVKTTYAQHLAIFTRELGLGEREKKNILGETARRLWFEPIAALRS